MAASELGASAARVRERRKSVWVASEEGEAAEEAEEAAWADSALFLAARLPQPGVLVALMDQAPALWTGTDLTEGRLQDALLHTAMQHRAAACCEVVLRRW